MKPLNDNLAIAVDGGGIKGTMVARALAVVEDHLGESLGDMVNLAVGTSTGSIISAGLAVGLSGAQLHTLYEGLGHTVFRKTLRSTLWPLTRYRYAHEPLRQALGEHISDRSMGQLWKQAHQVDLVVTAFDLVENRTRFIKPWKDDYDEWSLIDAVLASCSVPTYFPAVKGQFVDGGVGAYANPCYVAAYEAIKCLKWPLSKTTILSIGTGREPCTISQGDANRFSVWNWLKPVLGAFLQSADDQQVHLVDTFFPELDFRRFQISLDSPISMDDPSAIPELTAYGEELGRMILNDEMDESLDIQAEVAPGVDGLELSVGLH